MQRKALQLIASFVLVCIGMQAAFVLAQEATSTPPGSERENELANLIDDRTKVIADLEAQIAGFQNELKQLDGAKKTLQNEIRSLDLTRKKIAADISVTENKITKTNLELETLAGDIKDKESRISGNRTAISESLRIVNEYDDSSFVESMLSADSLDRAWEDIDAIENLQKDLGSRIIVLANMKEDLQDKQTEVSKVKNRLTLLRAQLSNQKKVVDYNAQQKNSLLATTKNSETTYQKLLREKTAAKEAFEKELLDFESELKLLKDPSSIPTAQKGKLDWPLDSVYVTQYFGNTKFARDNPQLYGGIGHNGIDLRASVGTPIKSSRGGEVVGTGNTDTVCPGASYGKWVLVEHENGLSTLYAHLSVISVEAGDLVGTGSVLGYSGSTGYSTGPHLHFTVYATQGVEIVTRKSRTCSGTYTMPVADLRAYLNPLSYLPELTQ